MGPGFDQSLFKTFLPKNSSLSLLFPLSWQSVGVRGALVEGCTFGVANGLIYLAEALLFYVGVVFIAKGMYTYLQMVQVLNLVVFSVMIGSKLMAFTNRITRAVQATQDMLQVL
ncbi:ATP-dependent permease [Stygiomarasmius scandens]|uniref:ATP-dependent permease n=1 Tax=Marasmiellus scandens TaxID=2682957 RepID=A0ABR1JA54_9AGAR